MKARFTMYVRASPNYLYANHVKQKHQPEQESFVTALSIANDPALILC